MKRFPKRGRVLKGVASVGIFLGGLAGAGLFLPPPAVADVPPGSQTWSARFNGPANGNDYAGPTAIDSFGNIYVSGRSSNGANDDYVLVKYDSDGNQLWAVRHDNGAETAVWGVTGLAIDSANRVYLVGKRANGSNDDFLVAQFDWNGVLLWEQNYDNGSNDQAIGLVIDGADNIYVAGTSSNGANDDYATLKYDVNGNLLWVARYDNLASIGDQPSGIGVDAADNVYVTGTSSNGTNTDIAIVKYSPTGEELWVARYDSSSFDYAFDLHVDDLGQSYISGSGKGADTYFDAILVKYDAYGNQVWSRLFDTPYNADAWGRSLAVDGAGNIYQATDPGYNSYLLKYDADGVLLWDVVTTNMMSRISGLRLDAAGNVYVSGFGDTTFAEGGDLATGPYYSYVKVAKYDSLGQLLWNGLYSEAVSAYDDGPDTPSALTLSPAGDVYVAAGLWNGSNKDLLLAKFAHAVDLIITADSGPYSITPGGSLALADTVTNQGLDDAVSFTVGYYLSEDAAFDNADLFLGERLISGLSAGNSSSATTTLWIPGAVTAGNYYIIAFADQTGAVLETDETNNTSLGASPSAAPGGAPDIALLAVNGLPATLLADEVYTFSYTFGNRRSQETTFRGPWVYLSTDAAWSEDDIKLGWGNGLMFLSPGLNMGPGEILTRSETFAACYNHMGDQDHCTVLSDGGVAPGPHYLIVRVFSPPSYAINTANSMVLGPVTVTMPDLRPTAIGGPASAATGTTVTITDTVTNQGSGSTLLGDSRHVNVSFYLAPDPMSTTGRIWLGSRTISYLAAGASSNGNTTVTIPTTVPAGTYYLRVDVAGQNISDSDLTNNTLIGNTIQVVDATPPTISAVAAGNITSSGATITWTTNEAADTQVEYGPTTGYGNSTTLNTSLVTSHSQALTGLTASTLYHYRVKSRDAAGNLATSGDFTFTTAAPSGTNLALAGTASAYSTHSSFNVNGPKDGGGDTTWGSCPGSCSVWAEKTASVNAWWKVDLLSPKILSSVRVVFIHDPVWPGGNSYITRGYNIQVSTDNSTWTTVASVTGNTSYTNTHTFGPVTARYVRFVETQGNPTNYYVYLMELEVYGTSDTTAPTISAVAAGNITSSGATITWTTNEAADTQVEYGPTTGYGNSTTLNTSLVTSHSQALTGLTASTLYHYRVKSRDAAGNLATSGDFTFTTAASYTLTVTLAGTGSGTVTSSPAGINCGADCTENYTDGTAVTLTATPASGSLFAGWSGNADCTDGSLTMNTNKSCTATFDPAPTYTLTVTLAGTGSGTVTSSPAGINCGADCTENYTDGTAVTLTATPASGSLFAGWSGNADCTDGSLTMNTNKSCTATFDPAPPGANYGVSLDGNNDYVSVQNHTSLKLTKVLTIEAWVNIPDYSREHSIVDKSPGNNQPGMYSFTIQSGTGKLRLQRELFDGVDPQSSYFGDYKSASAVPVNQWVHVAVVWGSSSVQFYINGTLAGSTSISSADESWPYDNSVLIGRTPAGDYFKGVLDEVRIWGIARSQADIQAAMNAELTGAETGLRGYWRFNEGAGTLADDSSSYSNNGTLLNGAGWVQVTW